MTEEEKALGLAKLEEDLQATSKPKDDLASRFTHHPPKDDGQLERYRLIRNEGLRLAVTINASCLDSREKSLALTKCEEAVFWANAAIARHG